MSHEDGIAFSRRFQNELFQQKYTAIDSPGWLYMAMFKAGGLSSKLVAVAPTPSVRTIESPSIIYDAFKNWAKPILGNSGTAILLFVTYRPSAGDVEDILKLGRGLIGGQISSFIYDLDSHKFWIWDAFNKTYSTNNWKP